MRFKFTILQTLWKEKVNDKRFSRRAMKILVVWMAANWTVPKMKSE